MIKINLLGKKKKPAPFGLDKALERAGINEAQIEELKPSLPKLLVIVAVLYLAYFIPNYFLEEKVTELRAQQDVVGNKLTGIKAELASLKKVREAMDKLTKDEADIEAQLSTIEGLSNGRGAAFQALNSIIQILPDKVWFDRINYNSGAISLTGGSWEYFAINDFVRSLTENTKFEAVTLRNIRAEPPGALQPGIPAADQKTKNFQIDMLLQGATREGEQ